MMFGSQPLTLQVCHSLPSAIMSLSQNDSPGITPLAFVPPTVPVSQSDWPTLGQMIDSGKRVVVFLDAGANTSSVDFILPEFEMVCNPPLNNH